MKVLMVSKSTGVAAQSRRTPGVVQAAGFYSREDVAEPLLATDARLVGPRYGFDLACRTRQKDAGVPSAGSQAFVYSVLRRRERLN
jgi:hypothetical protein